MIFNLKTFDDNKIKEAVYKNAKLRRYTSASLII